MTKAEKKEEGLNLPTSIQDEISKELAMLSQRVAAPSSNKIRLDGKSFVLPTGESSTEPMRAIVLDYTWSMIHYPGVYKAGEYKDPDCWAIGRERPESGDLKPHADVPEPKGETCKTCQFNKWGSDPNGGKACKNQRRLIIVPPKPTEDTIPWTLYVSPKALKNWDAYCNELSTRYKTVPTAVVTEVHFDPQWPYPCLTFKYVGPHADVALAFALKAQHQGMLFKSVELRG